jgi:hypothetical protein
LLYVPERSEKSRWFLYPFRWQCMCSFERCREKWEELVFWTGSKRTSWKTIHENCIIKKCFNSFKMIKLKIKQETS